MQITDDPSEAAAFLKQGKIVIFPTETVFGIGANALDPDACKKIYTIKGRPSDNPLILHTGTKEIFHSSGEIDSTLLDSFDNYIPGPLTLILKKKDPALFSAGLPTVGLRIPAHEKTLQMLKELPFPVAAPSANLSGKPSLTRLQDVIETFAGKADLLLRGEEPIHGIESTVVDLTSKDPLYLRAGVISFDELLSLLPNLKRFKGHASLPPPSPGMKYRHYAPQARVVLYQKKEEIRKDKSFTEIGFEVTGEGALSQKLLSNTEYARELFAFFTLSDKKKVEVIYCQKPQGGALEEALLERLIKASSAHL